MLSHDGRHDFSLFEIFFTLTICDKHLVNDLSGTVWGILFNRSKVLFKWSLPKLENQTIMALRTCVTMYLSLNYSLWYCVIQVSDQYVQFLREILSLISGTRSQYAGTIHIRQTHTLIQIMAVWKQNWS